MAASSSPRDQKPPGNEIPTPSSLGERIRVARLAREMTLTDVAQGDFSPSFLSLVEQGKSGLSLRSLDLIAQRLELPIGYFFEAEPGAMEAAGLVLDRAEADLGNDDPIACLRRLDGLVLPELLQAREQWLCGRALIASDQTQAGLSALQEGLSLAEKRQEHDLIPHIRYAIVQALLALRSYDEATVAARRALDAARSEPVNPILAGKALLALGHLLFLQGKPDDALHHYAQAQEMLEKVSDLAALAALHAGLSEAYEESGDVRAARQYAQSSATLSAVNSDARFITREHGTLAMHYLRYGKPDKARAAATEALSRAQKLGARDLEASARSILATIFLRLGDLPSAAEHAATARDLARDDHDLARIDAWVTLGEIAERTGSIEEADQLFERALNSCRANENQSRYAEICVAYSRLLQNRGDTDRALKIALLGAQAQAH